MLPVPSDSVDDVEVNRNGDGAVRVETCAVGGGAAPAALTIAVGRAVGRDLSANFLKLDVVGVARAALPAGLDEVFVRFENNAVGSDHSAVSSHRRLFTGIVRTPVRAILTTLRADIFERRVG